MIFKLFENRLSTVLIIESFDVFGTVLITETVLIFFRNLNFSLVQYL